MQNGKSERTTPTSLASNRVSDPACGVAASAAARGDDPRSRSLTSVPLRHYPYPTGPNGCPSAARSAAHCSASHSAFIFSPDENQRKSVGRGLCAQMTGQCDAGVFAADAAAMQFYDRHVGRKLANGPLRRVGRRRQSLVAVCCQILLQSRGSRIHHDQSAARAVCHCGKRALK